MKGSEVIQMEITRSHEAARYPSGVWKRDRNLEITFWRRWDGRFPRVRFIKYDNPTNSSIERVHRAILGMVK